MTDPRGIELRTTYDALGRRTKTVEAYVDGTPSNTDDKTTEFTYDGSGHLLTLKALLTGSDYQETKWVYGVTVGGGSGITSNDVLAEMWYPNKSTGAASSSEKEVYTVNALGESLTKTDRNGNVHTFSYDVAGRMTTDAVTTLGSGVDGAVRRLETAYDTAGRAYLFTSYDAAASGSIVNQVQREFNGLGQLITEYQAHSGAVNTGSSPKVQYAYSEMASSANHSRLVSMTYPNGRVIDYTYGSGLDTSISRLTSIMDGSDTLEAYSYLGLGTVVRRAQNQAGVELTYLKQGAEGDGEAGDKYAGLDRFGRIVDQRWMKTSDASNLDRFQYGYDRNGNRLFEKNLIDAAFSELYHANGASAGYDLLNQLSEFRRGTLSDANSDGVLDTVTTASRSQVWSYDPVGNWSTLTNDGTAQNRGHNRQNQITSITSLTTPTYDSNGNMTGDENGKTLKYDAWNRLVDYKNGGTSLESYKYDALNRRIEENAGTARALFYSAEWQVVEERTSGVARVSQVWSPVYIDALIVRDRDSDTNGSLDERLYAAHDANWNVSSILNTSAAVQERFVYDPFGTPSFKDASYGTRGSSNFDWTRLREGLARSSATSLYTFGTLVISPTLGTEVSSALKRAFKLTYAHTLAFLGGGLDTPWWGSVPFSIGLPGFPPLLGIVAFPCTTIMCALSKCAKKAHEALPNPREAYLDPVRGTRSCLFLLLTHRKHILSRIDDMLRQLNGSWGSLSEAERVALIEGINEHIRLWNDVYRAQYERCIADERNRLPKNCQDLYWRFLECVKAFVGVPGNATRIPLRRTPGLLGSVEFPARPIPIPPIGPLPWSFEGLLPSTDGK